MTAKNAKINKIEIVVEPDADPDMSYWGEFSNTPEAGALAHHGGPGAYKWFNPNQDAHNTPEYGREAYERMLAYERQEWCMVGVRAEATLVINGTLQTIQTPGVWGVESDSGHDYIEQEVGSEQYAELVDILKALGINEDNIPAWEDIDPAKHGE